MKKLKEKKLVVALISLLVICFLVIAFVMIKYFVGDSSSKYGTRLDGIDEVAINKEKISEIESKIKENTLVTKVKINIVGKIIYMAFTFGEKATLVEAQSIAITALENYSETESAYYDFQFALVKESTDKDAGFTIMGSKNTASGLINWNNNTKVEEEE